MVDTKVRTFASRVTCIFASRVASIFASRVARNGVSMLDEYRTPDGRTWLLTPEDAAIRGAVPVEAPPDKATQPEATKTRKPGGRRDR